ncbi:hypothetical protein VNO78_27434 [Psophocarpus tetragonolobus]|uniref:Uncharacterized protein n=1 Tax=Psophocarpus tetragonolobus TaxID=3891 RepID=A0AAN9XA34_PSOTE
MPHQVLTTYNPTNAYIHQCTLNVHTPQSLSSASVTAERKKKKEEKRRTVRSIERGNTRLEESAVLLRRSIIGAGQLQIAALASPKFVP